jgi:hypothetical protein
MPRTVRTVFSVRDPHPKRKRETVPCRPARQRLNCPKTGVSRPDTVKIGFDNTP